MIFNWREMALWLVAQSIPAEVNGNMGYGKWSVMAKPSSPSSEA
jgi:hypothetical protein